jgi:hypothetical protein
MMVALDADPLVKHVLVANRIGAAGLPAIYPGVCGVADWGVDKRLSPAISQSTAYCPHAIAPPNPAARRRPASSDSSHPLLPKLAHPECRLSERRSNFHNLRVSREKAALVRLRALEPAAGISSGHHDAFGEYSPNLQGE